MSSKSKLFYKSMKAVLQITVFLISAIFMAMYFYGPSDAKKKVICFGDSITFGAGMEGKGWPEQLSQMSTNFIFVNEGRRGRKTSDLKELLPVLERNLDSDLFIFLLGVNDLKNGNDSLVNECYINMRRMIQETKEKFKCAKILLLAPCGINLGEMSEVNRAKNYNMNTAASLINLERKYQHLAEEESVYFASLLKAVSPKNFLDGIHPNERGYEEISKKIFSELENIFPLIK